MDKKFTQEERKGLWQLFGIGLRGAENTLEHDPIEMPEGVTSDTLERYRKIAHDVISCGKDKSGVQKKRIEIIDRLLA